jgi:uncharacterized protein YjeT (DUF2065 family)
MPAMASAPRLSPPVVELSLDEQIALAEMQVIARDKRIRHRADALVRQVKYEAVRHAGGGLLLGAGTVLLTWWLNRLARKNAPAPGPAAAAAAPEPPPTFEHLFRDAGITLAGLLPVLWPMLPRAWRRIVTPGTAGTLLTFIAPLLGRLLRRKPHQTPTS